MRFSIERAIHTLHLYGAAGIACFGWAVCRLLGCEARPWLPLWFCAALVVYNIDRLRRDPADEVNTPARAASARSLRGWSMAVTLAAGGVLLGLPLWRGDGRTLAAALAGSAICVHYSIPFRGRRWKDVPLLKTFFAPAVVVAAVFGLPLLHEPERFRGLYAPLVSAWAMAVLLFNMVLCDARDLAGDAADGVVSLPSRLGPAGTRRLLWLLVLAAGASAGVLAVIGPARWIVHGAASVAWMAALLGRVRRRQEELFYERWVEGLLFVPAAVEAVCSFIRAAAGSDFGSGAG